MLLLLPFQNASATWYDDVIKDVTDTTKTGVEVIIETGEDVINEADVVAKVLLLLPTCIEKLENQEFDSKCVDEISELILSIISENQEKFSELILQSPEFYDILYQYFENKIKNLRN